MLYPETIFVKILLPTAPYLTLEEAMVEVPTQKGPYMILPRRAPTIMTLTDGVVRLFEAEKSEPEKYFISGGIVKARDNGCSILVNRVLPFAKADLSAVKKELQDLEKTFVEDAKQYKSDSSYPHIHREKLQNDKRAFLNMVAGYLEKTTA